MTEQWLIQDINKLLQHRNRLVILDPTSVLTVPEKNYNKLPLSCSLNLKQCWLIK